jgi:hypothetical protein
MLIRTQVYCLALFAAIVTTSTLVHAQLGTAAATTTPAAPPRSTEPSLFCAAVGQHFHVGGEQVRDLVDAGLSPSQVVVVYYLAEHSLRQPAQILAERQAGHSWREIARASGLQPESFYYPVASARRPFVNVNALDHPVSRDRWSWEQLPLTDGDIENLVNLRFLAEVGGQRVPDVLRLRSEGYDYVSIHHFLLAGQKTAQQQPAPRPLNERS